MINRQKRNVSLITFTPGLDEYGQPRQLGSRSQTIEMVITSYNHTKVDDVRYEEVTDLGLTSFQEISDTDKIKDGERTYQILYVVPTGRLTQVFLKKEQ